MGLINATCTWGEGPDVLVSFENHPFILHENPKNDPPPMGSWVHGYVSIGSFDLTADEAIMLADQLKKAAEAAMELDRSIKEYETQHRNTK